MSHSLLVIGAGNMGAAFCHGLQSRQKEFKVSCYDIHEDRLQDLVRATGVTACPNVDAKESFDALLLCVKPQDLQKVAEYLNSRISGSPQIISILAGVTLGDLEKAFGFIQQPVVVRAMPNIAATVGQAATAMVANCDLNDGQRSLTESLFNAVGESWWTREDLLDAVTGLSGSGPAYLYMVIEALTDGGVKMGLPRSLAAALSAQTVLGSATLVKTSGLHPAMLRDQVTTPGGTTINAIHELEDRGLRAMLISAVQTATERSKDLRDSIT